MRSTALALSVLLIVLYVLPIEPVVVARDSGLSGHLCYSFFHVSWLHLALNVYAFLCIAFLYRLSLRHLVWSYVIASCFPAWDVRGTAGLSVVCFALCAMWSYRVRDKRRYHLFMSVWLVLGLLLPGINGWAHLWGYGCGLLFKK